MAEPGGLGFDSIISSLACVDIPHLDDEQLARFVVNAEALSNAVHAASAVALEEFQRRGAWAGEGCLSAATWAAGRTGTPARELRARVRAGDGLRLLTSAAPVARAGRLTPRHVAALADCARRHPDLAARDEAMLVDQAVSLDAGNFAVAARTWQACADAGDGQDPADLAAEEPVDELHLSRTLDGSYQLSGSFAAQTGELLGAALDGEVDRAQRAAGDGDPSVALVASQVRAAALVDLATQTMRREPSDQSVPDRYRVAVVVAHDAAEPPLAACDSPAFRLVVNAQNEVLDVGRLTQQWPAGIRRAVTFRDQGCVFPGCDRPPSWCDIHHCHAWSAGGKTSIANGALLCRRHHTFVHQHHWTISVERGKPVTRRPDGIVHRITRWDVTPPGTGCRPAAAG